MAAGADRDDDDDDTTTAATTTRTTANDDDDHHHHHHNNSSGSSNSNSNKEVHPSSVLALSCLVLCPCSSLVQGSQPKDVRVEATRLYLRC